MIYQNSHVELLILSYQIGHSELLVYSVPPSKGVGEHTVYGMNPIGIRDVVHVLITFSLHFNYVSLDKY